MPDICCRDLDDVLIRIKAVPGASRDEITGIIGDRLKVRVSAPASGGQANKAICILIARVLGIKPNRVSIERGLSAPAKTVRVRGCTIDDVTGKLAGLA